MLAPKDMAEEEKVDEIHNIYTDGQLQSMASICGHCNIHLISSLQLFQSTTENFLQQ